MVLLVRPQLLMAPEAVAEEVEAEDVSLSFIIIY